MQIRLRPRVERVCPRTPEEVFGLIEDFHIRCAPTVVRVRMGQTHLGIELPEEQQHFWSPWLDLHVREHEEGSVVCGRFAPAPAVWTMFMAIYGAFAFATFVALSFAFVQWMLGMTQWSWWVALGPVVGWGVSFAAALVGQGLGDSQIRLLSGFLDAALDDASSRCGEPPLPKPRTSLTR